MTKLERMLVELGRATHEPEPPPIGRRVATQLRTPSDKRRFHARGGIATALIAVAIGAAAVSPARTSILRFFHLGGVTIERVDKLPPVSPRGQLAPGTDVGLARAQARASSRYASVFPIFVPERDPRPSHVFFYASDPPGGQVTLIYGGLSRPRLLITEFVASPLQRLFEKKVGPRTAVEQVRVGGSKGIWLGGAHEFSVLDGAGAVRGYSTRLASNTLVWQRGRLTLRLEGELSKSAAIRLAESFVVAR